MFLRKLKIENLRNLDSVDIEPQKGLNVFHGGNGAGKTSLIEAIVVLSRGRSFRTNQANELIGTKGEVFRIFSETSHSHDIIHKIGIERSGKHWRARKDGVELTQLSALTRDLPLVLMEPNSHLLVSGTPEFRRKFLDWGMFHVEHEYLGVHRRYSKILKQRNAALRFQKEELLESIDDVFLPTALRLSEYRRQHCLEISVALSALLRELNPKLTDIEVQYSEGWGKKTLDESLREGKQRDLSRGVTGSGPHRADISMKISGTEARSVFSRGEQKVLSTALLFAQGHILGQRGEKPVVLLDDLASEFDQMHFDKVLKQALECGQQVWITGTKNPELTLDRKVFHVERGRVQEMV